MVTMKSRYVETVHEGVADKIAFLTGLPATPAMVASYVNELLERELGVVIDYDDAGED